MKFNVGVDGTFCRGLVVKGRGASQSLLGIMPTFIALTCSQCFANTTWMYLDERR